MAIEYRTVRYFRKADLRDLFLSVEWGSGKYPELLCEAMKNYETVVSAWDGQKLVGLVCAMSDGVMNAYIPYVLVNPAWQKEGIGSALMEVIKRRYKDFKTLTLVSYDTAGDFYRKCGFKNYNGTEVLHISQLPD